MGKITKISTANMSREDWLVHRRQAIGGSDAATILGLNPYASPYTLWADKTSRLPVQPDNEAMRQGRDLEPYVVRRFEEATSCLLYTSVFYDISLPSLKYTPLRRFLLL